MTTFIPTHVETSHNKSGVGSVQVNAPIIGGTSTPEAERTKVRNELLAKIGPPRVEPKFVPGTCKWILNDDKFQSWRASSDQHLLWISGRPGKGKSHLAAFLGEELSRRTAESGSSLVLKFSCENADIMRSTSLAVHLNVLYQILGFRRSDVALHDDAASILNDTHTTLNTHIPRDDLWGIIKRFINREPEARDHPTYFILDGLDECDAESIEDLRKKLQHLCEANNRQGRPDFKAIILSRPLPNIGNRNLWINLDDDEKYGEQILHEIRLFIDDEMWPILGTRENELEKLKTTLAKRSKKTFLWVALALKLLKSHRSDLDAIVKGQGQDALDRLLPVGLRSIYNRMLLEALQGKYDNQGKFDAKSCAKIIQFICVAFRPLTLAEMQVVAGTSSDVSTIISNCRHILAESKKEATQEEVGADFEDKVFQEESPTEAKHHRHQQRAEDDTKRNADDKTFQLVHLSLKQYLQQPPPFMIPTPLGLLLWSPFSFTVDTLRAMMRRFYYLDHILFMAVPLFCSGLFKRYPAPGFVLAALLAPQLNRRWMQKRSWVLQMLLDVFESLLGRCLYGIFAASEQRSHRELFLTSITFLMDKKDGLQREKDRNLSRPGALSARKPMSVDAELAPFGQYACCFWVDHLFSLNEVDWTQQEETLYRRYVLQFFEGHLLDWLRNLSMQAKLRDGILSIRRLIQIFENRHSETRQLELLLKDTERFMMHFAPIIERAPFQIYATALAFCPNNSIVRSTCWDRVLPWAEKIRATQDDWTSVLQVLEGHTDRVVSVAFSNDGKLIASAAYDLTIRLWDAETGRVKRILTPSQYPPSCLAFSRHGDLVASSGGTPLSAAIEIWHGHTGNLVNSIEIGYSRIRAIACSPDSDVLATANDENLIQLWDLETCSFLGKITYERANLVTSMTFYPDGCLVALTPGLIKTWIIETWQSKCMIRSGFESGFHTDDEPWCHKRMTRLDSLVLSVNDQVTGQGPDHHTLHQWASKTGKVHGVPFQHSWKKEKVAFSPDRTIVASAHPSGFGIRLWDPTKNSLPPERPLDLENSHDSVNSMTISSGKKTLATVSSNNRVKLWSLQAGALVPRDAQFSHVSTVALSPRGDVLALSRTGIGYRNKRVELWSVTKNEKAFSLFGHQETVIAVGFSSDGHTLASFSNDSVRLWNPVDGASRKVLKPIGSSFSFPQRTIDYEFPVSTFSPDNMSIAFATGQNLEAAIEICNYTSAHDSRVCLTGLVGAVVAMSFSPDGRKIASVSLGERKVKIWDTATGQILTKLKIQGERIRALTLSPGHSHLILSSRSGAVQVWDLSKKTLEKVYHATEPFSKLALSDCGTYIRTERGVIELQRSGSRLEIYVDGQWIVRGQDRVLWLPPDMRANHAVLADDMLILGCISGDVKLVQF